jgi:hypothetical protein
LIFVRDFLIKGNFNEISVIAFNEIITNRVIYSTYIEPLIPGDKSNRDDINFLNRFYINSTKIFNTRRIIKMYNVSISNITNTAQSELDSIRILSMFLGEHFEVTPEDRDKSGMELVSKKGTRVKVKNLSSTSVIIISKVFPYKITILNSYLEVDANDYKKYDYLVFYNQDKDKLHIFDTKAISDVQSEGSTTIYNISRDIDNKSELSDKIFMMNIKEDNTEVDDEYDSED